jgi:hypothetical protein
MTYDLHDIYTICYGSSYSDKINDYMKSICPDYIPMPKQKNPDDPYEIDHEVFNKWFEDNNYEDIVRIKVCQKLANPQLQNDMYEKLKVFLPDYSRDDIVGYAFTFYLESFNRLWIDQYIHDLLISNQTVELDKNTIKYGICDMYELTRKDGSSVDETEDQEYVDDVSYQEYVDDASYQDED